MEILILTNISVLGFYGYIGYIGRFFYMNIDISEINKNTLKFMKIFSKSKKMTLIIKYIHYNKLFKSNKDQCDSIAKFDRGISS